MDWELLAAIMIISVVMVMTIVGITAGVYVSEKKACSDTAKEMVVDSKYGFWTGCLINVQGNWIHLDSYIINNQVGE